MHQKTYTDDLGKARIWEHLGNFIERTLFRYKRPRDVSLAFFPGPDGLNSLELQMYDNLGIPRRNMTGIESDHDVYRTLQQHNLQVDPESRIRLTDTPMTDGMFFKSTDSKFDVLSLDYTGPFTYSRIVAIEDLLRRGKMSPRCVIYTNFLGKREPPLSRYMVLSSVLAKDSREQVLGMDIANIGNENFYENVGAFIMNTKLELMKEANKNVLSRDALKRRGDAITNTLLTIFSQGKRHVTDRRPVYKALPEIENFDESVKEYFSQLIRHDTSPVHDERLSSVLENAPENLTLFGELYGLILTLRIEELLVPLLAGEPLAGPSRVRAFANHLAFYLNFADEFRYLPQEIERYRYVSSTGSPMLSDIIFFDNGVNTFSRNRDIIRVADGDQPRIVINQRNLKPRLLLYMLNKIILDFSKFARISEGDKIPDRIDLTPERKSKPQYEKEILTVDDAISLLSDGIPILEIIEAFPDSFTEKQLKEMTGKVSVTNLKVDTVETKPEYTELTKELVISLFRDGLSVNDVMDMHPNSELTKGQLSAIKAHVTMGRYGERHVVREAIVGTPNPEGRRLTEKLVGNSMLPYIDRGVPVRVSDISQDGDDPKIVAMLMANWLKRHPNVKYVRRVGKGGPAYIPDPAAITLNYKVIGGQVVMNDQEEHDVIETLRENII